MSNQLHIPKDVSIQLRFITVNHVVSDISILNRFIGGIMFPQLHLLYLVFSSYTIPFKSQMSYFNQTVVAEELLLDLYSLYNRTIWTKWCCSSALSLTDWRYERHPLNCRSNRGKGWEKKEYVIFLASFPWLYNIIWLMRICKIGILYNVIIGSLTEYLFFIDAISKLLFFK